MCLIILKSYWSTLSLILFLRMDSDFKTSLYEFDLLKSSNLRLCKRGCGSSLKLLSWDLLPAIEALY